MNTRMKIHLVADYLMAHADRLEEMAIESRRGGWSTHQVEEQRRQAQEARKQACTLYEAANNVL